MAKVDILVPEPVHAHTLATLDRDFATHHLWEAPDQEALLGGIGARIRGLARGYHMTIGRPLLERLPNLEIIANFGVGYDGIDVHYAAENGIIVTNTPDVLTEEVADTALGLLIMTVRELSAAERYVRAGGWAKTGNYRLTPGSLRDRTVGMVGLGRIGAAIARRLDAAAIPVAYHTRNKRPDVAYRHYADLREMAEAVDTLLVIVPGNAATRHLIDASILKALGPRGVLINVGRGMVVDEAALIEALQTKTILAAGLDVFVDEPNVPEALLAMDNVVLLPHVGSASMHTRDAMGQLMVDNLKSWFAAGKPLTPVAETPWPRQK